jgi:hypothetical protein
VYLKPTYPLLAGHARLHLLNQDLSGENGPHELPIDRVVREEAPRRGAARPQLCQLELNLAVVVGRQRYTVSARVLLNQSLLDEAHERLSAHPSAGGPNPSAGARRLGTVRICQRIESGHVPRVRIELTARDAVVADQRHEGRRCVV